MKSSQNSKLQNLKNLLQSLPPSTADWIGIREYQEKTTLRIARDGKPDNHSEYLSHGVMIEVLVNGQFAYASTPNFSRGSLHRAFEKAFKLAQKASEYKIFSFTPKVRPPSQGSYVSSRVKPLSLASSKEVMTLLQEISARIKNKNSKIISGVGFARWVETEIAYCSTNDSAWEQNFNLISFDFSSTAQDGPIIQTRTDGGLLAKSYQAGLEVFDRAGLWDDVDRVAEQSIELISAPECPTMTTDLVVMPDQMMLQIHESVGHPLEIDRILGDERNYAGSSFVQLEDFGKLRYGSDLMNITYDPTLPNEFASYAFDDCGVKAEKQYIIRKGILERGLGSAESQARSGVPGVANSRSCSWNRPPIDRMANLNLEPGKQTFEEILSSIEDGILVESNRSWSIDDYQRKFQFGCEYGKRIRNGKCAETVRNPNYRGFSSDFWRNLKQIGNADTVGVFGTPFCGKGEPNQVIRVGHASPVCHFQDIEVFGGAS